MTLSSRPVDEDVDNLTPQPPKSIRWLFPTLRSYATAMCLLIVVGVDMAGYLYSAPQIRLFESIVCRDYYRVHDPGMIGDDGNVPERYCKINEIQGEIAMLKGFQTLFENLPGVFLAIPFGILADRVGRKMVLSLILVGLALEPVWVLFVCWFGLPIRLTWFSAVFLILGGGAQMGSAMLLMILADVTPEEQRTSVFFQLSACVLISELVAPPLGSLLMSQNVWIPLFVGLAIQITTIPLGLAVPETRGLKAAEHRSNEEEEAEEEPKKPSRLQEILKFLRTDINVTLLVSTFFVTIIGRQTLEILLQYVSKRYGWSLAKANFLLSVRAAVNLVLLLVVLPALNFFLMEKWSTKISSEAKDLLIARGSILLMAFGFVGIAMAPTAAPMVLALMLYTLGTGFTPAARSLVTTMVDPSHVGLLYTTISVLDTLGGLVAGPAVSFAFRKGLRLGGPWIGLPFLVSAGLFAAVAAVVWVVRVRPAGYEPLASGDGVENGQEIVDDVA